MHNVNFHDYIKNNHLYSCVNATIGKGVFLGRKLKDAKLHLNDRNFEASIALRINRFVKHIFRYIFNPIYRDLFGRAIHVIRKQPNPVARVVAVSAPIVVPRVGIMNVPSVVRRAHILPYLDLYDLLSFGATDNALANDALHEIVTRYPRLAQRANGIRGLILAKNQYEDELDIGKEAIFNALKGLTYIIRRGLFNQCNTLGEAINKISPLGAREVDQIFDITIESKMPMRVPAEIGEFSKLQYLSFRDSLVLALPAEIGQLNELDTLDLYDTKIKLLPPEIGQLNQLRYLNLGRNLLTHIPPVIWELGTLKILSLIGNQLNSIPREIGQLTILEDLYLSDNQLTELPAEIGQLGNLTILNLSNNRITELPEEIQRLQNLRDLKLTGNPLSLQAIAQIRAWLPNTVIVI